MKKVILVILTTLMLVGCSSKPFSLDAEYYDKNELIDINSEELTKLEEDNKSFVVFVYTQGCITCYDFEKYLSEFMEENQITMYAISAPEMKKTDIADYIKYSPSVILYKNGKIISYLDAESDDDKKYYESTEDFTKWFTKYVTINK